MRRWRSRWLARAGRCRARLGAGRARRDRHARGRVRRRVANAVRARLALPGPARAVAISPDGQRGYVAAGNEVVAVDVNARAEARARAARPARDLRHRADAAGAARCTSYRAGASPCWIRRRSRCARAVALNGDGTRLAIDPTGQLAAVVLANGRVAMVSLARNALLRHVKVPGAVGVAIDAARRTLVSARGRLRTIAPASGGRKRALKLPNGAGGGLALSAGALAAGRRRSARRRVGGARGPARAASCAPARRPRAGLAGVEHDSSRILMADAGAASMTLVSPFSRGRVATSRCPARRRGTSSCSPASRVFVGTEARTSSPARAGTTASRGSAATTCCAAAAGATASTAARATTACRAGRSATS